MSSAASKLDKIIVKRKVAAKILLKSVTYAFAIFGLFFILLLLILSGMLKSSGKIPVVGPNTILEIDLDASYAEIRRDSIWADMGGKGSLSFTDLLISIDTAGQDPNVKAIAAKISIANMGLAQKQEVFDAIRRFRAKGKKAYLYSSGFGSLGSGTSEYYLATAFDEITMLPNSDVGTTGVSVEVPFLRNVLDKFGVAPEFYTRHEYKTAMASFTDKEPSKAFVSEIQRLVAMLNVDLLSAITYERFGKADKDKSFEIVDKSPMSAEEALTMKLVDKIAYEADWRADLSKENKGEFMNVADYAATWSLLQNKNKFAVLVLDGVISDGTSIDNPINGEANVGSDTVLAQIEEIAKDKNIKGVLVRVNSPGGSYTASNQIWYALNKLKTEKKVPLIVSMGDYAASGGYFVALAGDKIYADKGTITGSIGVLGGKMVLEDLWKKLGVNWMQMDISETSGILSMNRHFNPKQKELFNKSLDRVYTDFTTKVADARKIDIKELDKLARGRVFVGVEAKENRLVDELGGFNEAFAELESKAGLGENEKFSISFYPKQKSLQEKIAEFMGGMQVSVAEQIKTELGLDISAFNMLKRLQYDAVLLPMVIK